jgi:hypothetical protein
MEILSGRLISRLVLVKAQSSKIFAFYTRLRHFIFNAIGSIPTTAMIKL